MKLKVWIDSFPRAERTARRQALADFLGVSESTVRSYANGNRRIKAEHVRGIFRFTDCAVTPNDSRPDLYPACAEQVA